MSFVDLQFTFDDKSTQEILDRLNVEVGAIAAAKREKLFKRWSVFVFKDIMAHFKSQMGDEGKWPAWSPKYYRKEGQILRDRGDLRNNFKETSYRRHGDGILWYNNAETKDEFPYAYAHNEGGPILPKRQFMWLSRGAIEYIAQDTLDYMIELLFNKA